MLQTVVFMTVYYMVYLNVNTPCFILMLTHNAFINANEAKQACFIVMTLSQA